MNRLFATLLAGALALATEAALAQGMAQASLDGFQEVPAISTTGSGELALVGTQSGVEFTLTYGDLEGAVEQAHIHFGQAGVNGGISVFLCTNLGNGPAGTQPCPSSPATVTGTLVPNDVIGPEEQGIAAGEAGELLQAIADGVTYVNVHTDLHPAGEIRGQIEPTF